MSNIEPEVFTAADTAALAGLPAQPFNGLVLNRVIRQSGGPGKFLFGDVLVAWVVREIGDKLDIVRAIEAAGLIYSTPLDSIERQWLVVDGSAARLVTEAESRAMRESDPDLIGVHIPSVGKRLRDFIDDERRRNIAESN